jgi:hypothetical protein
MFQLEFTVSVQSMVYCRCVAEYPVPDVEKRKKHHRFWK